MTALTLTIDGMTCGHCVRGVTKALTDLPGVAVEQVVIGQATVQYDPATATPEQITEAIRDEGYQVVERR